MPEARLRTPLLPSCFRLTNLEGKKLKKTAIFPSLSSLFPPFHYILYYKDFKLLCACTRTTHLNVKVRWLFQGSRILYTCITTHTLIFTFSAVLLKVFFYRWISTLVYNSFFNEINVSIFFLYLDLKVSEVQKSYCLLNFYKSICNDII